EKPTVEITEADIDKMIDVLRKQQATWVESKAAAKADSRVTIDFVGSVDGEEFEGGKATDFVLFMGQGRMIPGFEESIVGHKAGEQFDINVTFPAEYHSENLKGKDAKFAITLKKVEEMELPELTDEFVAKFGPNTKTVINGLIEQNPIDVPASAVEEEINVLRNQAAQRFGGNAQQAAQLPRELFEADAKRRVQVGLLFSEVIKSNELKADEERAKAMIADIASAYEQPAEVVEYYSQNEELMNNIRNVVLEEQAVDVVLAKAQVTEKASSFDEIMNPQA
ncbi:MAG: trigger factor, partial [Haemophilus parainfluenzae]|nr:trigger factor [Haemophilus parainfluenzae]